MNKMLLISNNYFISHLDIFRPTKSRRLAAIVVSALFLFSQSVHSGGVADFAAEVIKKVAVDIIASAIKGELKSGNQQKPQVVSGTSEDSNRIRNIVKAFIDTNSPLSERVGLYATSVDYFSSGVVGHDFIIKDRQYFEKRWPIRSYSIRSIDEIAVAPDRTFAIARYTVDYKVTREGETREGVSQVALVIGSFHTQPRIHAIKEWVTRVQ